MKPIRIIALALIILTGVLTFLPDVLRTSTPPPPPPHQTTPFDPVAFAADWAAWRDATGVVNSTVAVGQSGTIQHTFDHGRTGTQAYPMASLSKAVTAICLHNLLDETPYTWSTTLGDLRAHLAQIGPPPHASIASLSLAQIATQTSGLPRNGPQNDTARTNTFTQIAFIRAALSDPGIIGERGAYHYSNVNYALLGHVIEALSGGSYGDHCKNSIMIPALASGANVAGRMWATEGFGGWQMSVHDYARFAMHWFAPNQPWVADRTVGPTAQNIPYGLGVFHFDAPYGHFITHSGHWKSDDPAHRHGSIFMTSHTGTVIVASWQGSIEDADYAALSDILASHLR